MKTILFKKDTSVVEKIEVGKILCLGKNYLNHAKEMGGDIPKSPIIFMKPSSSIAEDFVIEIPKISNELHHEVELAVLIGKKGKNINLSDANNFVSGYAVGLDMTLRDQQALAKKEGTPWTIAKAFDTSAIFGTFIPQNEIANPDNLEIKLSVNGNVKQHSNTNFMIYKIDFIISYLSEIFLLEPGDIIFMGTPEGVGKVVSGDTIEAEIEGLPKLIAKIK
ncbi:MAG: fumarylacetoacetate hydrolase family protein [Bacteroidetes bacterium]|nr:fumarylacetoacetate hydrolase family protein [Bacteroidota bacterium]